MEALSSGTLKSPSSDSKTGSSSRSGSKSTVDKDKDREFDLSKDNALSPVDMECQIQAERLTKILDEATHKIKLCILLPILVKEYDTLCQTISKDHFDDLMYIFEQYDNPMYNSSLIDVNALENLQSGDFSMKFRLNPELGHVVYILNLNYEALKPKVEEMIYNMKWQYQRQSEGGEPMPELEFLIAFERFREQLVGRLNISAAVQLANKIRTRKLEESNVALLGKIEEYTKVMKEETEKFEKVMSSRTSTIAKLDQDLAFLNHAASMRLEKQILDSDRQMVIASRTYDVKNAMLKDEEVETKEYYEQFLKKHLTDEKKLRAKRFKVETQLLSWLQKYDTDMLERQEELDDYAQKYEDELKKCKELEKKLAEQDIEYIPLMAERDEEYDREMTAKMQAFLLDHAARVIQHAWRDVLANRAEKKRLRKLVQKMKEDQERAVRRKEALEKAALLAAAKKKKGKKK